MAWVDTRMWYDVGADDTPLSDSAAEPGGRDGRERPIDGADSGESTPTGAAPSSGAHALSGPGGDTPSDGAHAFLSEDRPDSDIAGDKPGSGLEADSASAGDQSADGPVDDLSVDDPVDDLPDDGPADDDGGVSPVVREYVEGLRREALARDAQLRARGIDPYKGVAEDEGPRRRLGARALVVLVVLVVAAVSVGAYVVFFHGEPDYGMSHGYQVQSDGSLKRPPITDKAPVQPAEMGKGDEAGAAAAARYYLNAYSYAWNTGDTAPIKAISGEGCAFCQREIAQIDEFYSNGYWATGTYASITNTDSIDRVSDDAIDAVIYDVQFHIDEHTPEGYSSKGYESGSRYDTIIKFRVQWKENEWRVVDGRAANADAVS